MLRHPGLIAVGACFVASVGCDGGGNIGIPTPLPPSPTVTVEFGGRVVNAEAAGPVESVRVSHSWSSSSSPIHGWVPPMNTATSGGDGTFTLPLKLPVSWRFVSLKLTGPPGYDDRYQSFEPTTAADRPAIRMYPTLVIGPGESIEVRVDASIVWCGWDGYACRRVLVAASPGDSVELEVVSHDSSKPMALGLANPASSYNLEPDMSVRRLMVPPGGVPYVIGDYPTGTATLTARR
jgi:hypothetical protein